jgi:legumain
MRAAVVVIVALLAIAQAKDWAVIVAGSNTYGNYRHQSDACHAVQIVKAGGIPAERIINMVYDDIANNPSNPYKGQVFNKPTPAGTPGKDIWAGCQKDYTGSTVTAKNFLNVLTGNAAGNAGQGNGKVLNSTKDDNVFIYFTDHGGVGIIAFPVGPYLGVTDLNNALNTMFTKKMYNKVVFYLEACESGSMFEGVLAPNKKIYATTAANAHESSYGFYCPPQDKVNGKSIGSCLGDEYSVAWLENTDTVGQAQSLQTQFNSVKTTTKMSHVMMYGDASFQSDPLSNFLSDKQAARKMLAESKDENNDLGRVESRDIPMHLAYYEYLRTDKSDMETSHKLAEKLIAEVEGRIKADNMFLTLTKAVTNDVSLFTAEASMAKQCGQCCDTVNNAVFEMCGGYTDYSFKYARVVWNLCTSGVSETQLVHTLRALCMA